MPEKHCVIGIDYGTLSARAVVVDARDGSILSSFSWPYPHGVLTDALPDGTPLDPESALAWAPDYDEALITVVQGALRLAPIQPEEVAGICVDATSLTMVLTDASGHPLSTLPGLEYRPQAQIKMWKHHAAQEQADRFSDAAKKAHAPFLRRYGMAPSCEWMIPKLMEVREKDREVYNRAVYAMDLCDYLTWKLSGRQCHALNAVGFKCFYLPDKGYPEKAFLDSLYPGDGSFGEEYWQKLSGPVLSQCECVGTLSKSMAETLGLSEDVRIAPGMIDGYTSLAACGLHEAGDATLVVGTSAVLSILTDTLAEIPGICGICFGGFGPQLYGIDSGQNCSGDMLDWYMHNALPASVENEAKLKGISPHTLLSEKAAAGKPWENPLTVLDWWAGNRNILCNMHLKGSILGLGMQTRPEDIYCALLQGIVCGTRHIMDHCKKYNAPVKNMVACGGIPSRNPFLMQQYANILGMPVQATATGDAPAIGSAILAATAAGLYPSLEEAEAHMMVQNRVVYQPDTEHRNEYEALYQRSKAMHDLLGGDPPALL